MAESSYVIELKRWNIRNDGSQAVSTTKGINDALIWAQNNGYSGCKLPSGSYLVDKDSQIQMVSNMTLDLFGCLIKKETNGYQNYVTISVTNKANATILGGVIQGDKGTHDYTTINGPHEGGKGIEVTGSRNTTLDSVEVKETTGYGIAISFFYNHSYWVYLSDLETGTFDSAGKALVNANWVRTNKFYALSEPQIQKMGYFMVCGNGYGGYGNGLDLSKKLVTAFFYDNNNNYLGQLTRRTYEEFYVSTLPAGATKFKLSYRYKIGEILDSTTTIRSDAYSKGVNIVNCFIHDCRTLGISGSGQYINIENCEISKNGGTAPGFGIDIEDGYNLNQNITIRNNYFHDNKNGDVVVVSARNVLLELNKFNGTVSFGGSRGENYVSQYNEYNGATGSGTSLNGGDGTFCVFRYDHFTGGQPLLSGNLLYENSVFDEVSFLLQSDNYLETTFKGCRFNFDNPDQGWAWNMRKGSLVFYQCEFTINCKYYYFYNEGHFGDPTKNNLTLKECVINASIPLGGYKVNKLILIGNSFIGTKDNKYQYLDIQANNVLMTDNVIDGVNMNLNGGIGTNSIVTIKDNSITINKSDLNFGPERNEGIYIRRFDTVFVENNKINFIYNGKNQLRGLSIFSEKMVNIKDNNYTSSTAISKIELFGAYRANGDTIPVPLLVAVIKDNISSKVTEVRDSTFITQLSRTAGNETVNLESSVGDDTLGSSVSVPITGVYVIGQKIYNSVPKPGGYLGWICTSGGYANNQTWIANKSYTKGNRINLNGHVYESMNSGTSGVTRPTFPTNSGGSVNDNNIIWKEIGLLAIFNTFGIINPF
ncbi:hypothetical protein ASG89_29940 [Paenibacillus sp. Soil766]|uniref:right-handed parallel beta-helix repeat-containing protein n=1 Tax=Paenibacillus sp. Soil766 TaxID=1736404 RepID=UPI00070E7AA4|nr:right-handed parallel beta-helix repeat-containing protein [Paenibacillus sp. Soil766]KRE97081.1 hypothetical protein ASG89_29940 [Paenibacillus sp. Soil766]